MTTQELNGHYFKVPNNINLVCNDTYELAILTHLLQRQNGDGDCFPSIITLQQGIMGRKKVIHSIKH